MAALLCAAFAVLVDGAHEQLTVGNLPAGAPPSFPSHRDSDYNLTIEENPAAQAGYRLSLLIRRKNGAVARVALPLTYDVGQIARAPSEKAIVIGRSPNTTVNTFLIDLGAAVILDSFWAWTPTPSPNGRWIAFVRAYPAHFADCEDQYLIYDVIRAPRDNRTWTPDDGIPDDPQSNVGLHIYSLKAGEIDRWHCPTTEMETQPHQSISSFYWSHDSSRVAFADLQGDLVRIALVEVHSDGGWRTRIASLTGKDEPCRGSLPQVRAIEFKPDHLTLGGSCLNAGRQWQWEQDLATGRLEPAPR